MSTAVRYLTGQWHLDQWVPRRDAQPGAVCRTRDLPCSCRKSAWERRDCIFPIASHNFPNSPIFTGVLAGFKAELPYSGCRGRGFFKISPIWSHSVPQARCGGGELPRSAPASLKTMGTSAIDVIEQLYDMVVRGGKQQKSSSDSRSICLPV